MIIDISKNGGQGLSGHLNSADKGYCGPQLCQTCIDSEIKVAQFIVSKLVTEKVKVTMESP